MARDLLGHLRGKQGGAQQLVFEQAVGEILAEHHIGQPALAQRGEIGLLVELASQRAERLDLQDFAVDQVVAGAQAIFAGVTAHRIAIDQLAHDFVKRAGLHEFGHGQRRVLLAYLLERGIGRRHQFGIGDRFVAHHRDVIGARDPADAGARNVGRDKGQRHQYQKAEENRQADLGLEEATEEGEHCWRNPGD